MRADFNTPPPRGHEINYPPWQKGYFFEAVSYFFDAKNIPPGMREDFNTPPPRGHEIDSYICNSGRRPIRPLRPFR